MVVNRSILATFFLLFFCIPATAQRKEREPLEKILAAIEQRFSVVFTYADKNVTGRHLTPPPHQLTLEETLNYLRENTGLRFDPLNERYIIIRKGEPAWIDICGILVHQDTGEPVEGASIQYGESFSISDDRGYFHLTVDETDTLHVRYVGYKTLHVPVREFAGPPCRRVALHPELTTLQSVFISDFITQGIDKKRDGALLLRAETLGMLPGLTEPDVLQTIQTLPGIQSINESISDITVRGGTNDQNLILWDGIRMYQSGHFFGLISAFNPYITENVTLVKNGSGADAGDGVSSTIDIRTDDQLSERFSAAAGINMINTDILAKIPLSPKASLHLSARRSIADWVKTPTYNRYFTRAFGDLHFTDGAGGDSLVDRNESFHFYDTSVKFLYNITRKDRLRVSFLNVKNELTFQENARIRETRTSSLAQQNLGTGIFYTRLWSESLRTSAQLYLSSYKLGAVNFDIPNNQVLVQENDVLDTGLKADARLNIGKNIGLFTGYQFFETGITNLDEINNPPFRRSVTKVLRRHAAFSEMDFTFRQTSLRVGIRGNYLPAFRRFITEPRFALNQNLLRNFYVELLAEMKHQTTAQIIDLQTDFLGVEKRRWVLSNDADIPVIRSRQLSAGIYYKQNSLLISVDAYYKRVNGIITSSQGFQNQFQFVRSSGNYKTVGIDFLVTKKVDPVTLWLSYSNAKNTLEFNALVPPAFPGNLDIPQRATFGTTFQTGNFELSGGLNWHSGKPYTEPATNIVANNIINYTLPNSARADEYLRIDISGKYRFPISPRVRAQVGASIWNVLDRKNIINTYFRITDDQRIERIEQDALARTVNVLFRVEY